MMHFVKSKLAKNNRWSKTTTALTGILLGFLVLLVVVQLNLFNSISQTIIPSTVQTSKSVVNFATRSAAMRPKIGEVAATSSSQTATSSAALPVYSGRSVNVPILMYHYIGNNPSPADKARDELSVDPQRFDDEMGYLQKNGYHPISLDTMYAGLKGVVALPSKPIVLTFDDGYVDFYINAFPILKKYGFHAVSFIPTGLMDGSYYLHWSQIKEMDASGLISFQAHSVNHLNLNSLGMDQLKYQISESKKVLEAQLGKRVNFMAYPYGISDAQVWQVTQEAGFLGAAGTWGGRVESEGAIYDMPRIKIPGGISLEDFAKRV